MRRVKGLPARHGPGRVVGRPGADLGGHAEGRAGGDREAGAVLLRPGAAADLVDADQVVRVVVQPDLEVVLVHVAEDQPGVIAVGVQRGRAAQVDVLVGGSGDEQDRDIAVARDAAVAGRPPPRILRGGRRHASPKVWKNRFQVIGDMQIAGEAYSSSVGFPHSGQTFPSNPLRSQPHLWQNP